MTTEAPAAATPAPVVQPGELGIRLRRSWPTWLLVMGVLGGVLVGTFIGHSGASGAPTSAQKSYAPPPPAGAATSAPTTTAAPAPATAGSSSSATTTTAAASGSPQVLVPRFESSQSSWTSRVFTITGGTWNIGWAYRCTPAPAGGAAFTVAVVPSGGAASGPPAVSGSSASDQGVTPQSTTGAQSVMVTAAPGCLWVVQVTGIGS
jgi:hypothetical protein